MKKIQECQELTKKGLPCQAAHYKDNYCGSHHPEKRNNKSSKKKTKIRRSEPFECPAGKHATMKMIWIRFSAEDEKKNYRPWCDECILSDVLSTDDLVDWFVKFYRLPMVRRSYVYSMMLAAKYDQTSRKSGPPC